MAASGRIKTFRSGSKPACSRMQVKSWQMRIRAGSPRSWARHRVPAAPGAGPCLWLGSTGQGFFTVKNTGKNTRYQCSEKGVVITEKGASLNCTKKTHQNFFAGDNVT